MGEETQQVIHIRYAGFWIRFLAKIVDLIIVSLCVMLLVGAEDALMTHMYPRYIDRMAPTPFLIELVLYILALFLLPLSYFAFMEISPLQATIGKWIFRLRVTDLQGNKIKLWQALVRHFLQYLGAAILYADYFVIPFRDKKQSLHDIVAQTVVVRKSTRTRVLNTPSFTKSN
jgi:uncharacterized RDD family membrane protein YckC